MNKLRLRFEKTDRAIYISHLDLMRTMQRAFNRAGYALKYSEGFNPRPQISIALPLSVGMGSVCEIMDFTLKEDPDLAELPERLTQAMPEGIRVIEAYEPQRKSALLKWLAIRGVFEYDERDPAVMCPALQAFFDREEIVILRRTKRGEGESDIRPAIRSLSFTPGEKCVALEGVISAQNPTLNPDLLADALRQLQPEIAPDFAKFTRLETYDESGELFR